MLLKFLRFLQYFFAIFPTFPIYVLFWPDRYFHRYQHFEPCSRDKIPSEEEVGAGALRTDEAEERH